MVEATHGKLGFTAPLTAITAAVVGVIANLAVFFMAHVLLNAGETAWFARVDWFALAISAAAAFGLWRLKLGVIPVILACATAGLVLRLLGWVG